VVMRARSRAVGGEVLVVLHNAATIDRLVDVRAVLHDHADIKIMVTFEEGSRRSRYGNGDGVRKRLRDLGIDPISWRDATRRRFAVVIATHATSGLLRRRWPNVVVMPHGAGYNRIVPRNTGSTTTPVGLSRRELTRWGGLLVPRVICLSAEEQRQHLAGCCRRVLSRVRVLGDPAYALLRRSEVRRQSYRDKLGVGRDQLLVVLASTWTQWSLYRAHKDIATRLLAQLPADRYRVVLVQHPNIAAEDSEFGIDCRLKTAKAAGLTALPPYDGGWRAALIAADIVVGDHGSVTFYGGAIGRPVLALRTGVVELANESPFRDFVALAAELHPDGDLRAQVERAIADYRPGQFDDVVERVIGTGEDALEQLRSIIFELLGRPEPTRPIRFDAVPDPAHTAPGRVTSYQVRVLTRRHGGRLDEVELERVPTAVADRPWQGAVEDVITMFEHDEVNLRGPERSEIVLNFDETDAEDAMAWTARAHSDLPGVLMATATHGANVVLRLGDGRTFTAVPVQRGKRISADQLAYMASALLRALVLDGTTAESVDVKVIMAPCEAIVRIRPTPC
jgi:hypothetical protein